LTTSCRFARAYRSRTNLITKGFTAGRWLMWSDSDRRSTA
ncbi:hypothetical protein CEXT_233561, partial [Caerostris extrusa]